MNADTDVRATVDTIYREESRRVLATLIRLLGDVRPAGRSDPHPEWRRFSVALTWFGALGLVILGGHGPHFWLRNKRVNPRVH